MSKPAIYSIFIDDERIPKNDPPFGEAWVICRSVQEAKDIIAKDGVPGCISFDHDLGDHVPTGYDLAKWMVEESLDGRMNLEHFSFIVHSANPIGAQNIIGLLEPYLLHISRTLEGGEGQESVEAGKGGDGRPGQRFMP